MNRRTFTIERLKAMRRPDGYFAELLACAVSKTAFVLTFDPDSSCYRSLQRKYRAYQSTPRPEGNPPPAGPLTPLPTAASRPPIEDLTRRLWAELHRYALTSDLGGAQDWLAAWSRRVPCGKCQLHWNQWVRKNPPHLESNERLFAWSVAAHNAVNFMLGKPLMNLHDAAELYTSST
jgi:hypothetical protein